MVFRARTVAEIFDLSIRSYRRRFKQYFIVAAVGLLPGMLLSLAALGVQAYVTMQLMPANGGSDFDPRIGLPTYPVIDTLVSLAQNTAAMMQSALSFGLVVPLINIVFAADIAGETIGLREAFRRLRKLGWNLVVVLAVLVGLYVALMIWTIIPCVGWMTGFPMVIFYGWVSPMAVTILIVEGKQAWAAVKRAWVLVRQRLWAALGMLMTLSLFGQIVLVGPLAVLALFLLIPLQGMGYRDLYEILPTVATGSVGGIVMVSLSSVLLFPATTLVTSHWYLDLRTRFEALDLSLRAHERAGDTIEAALRDAPDVESEKFYRGGDLSQFFLMTLAFAAFFVALWGALMGVMFAAQSLFAA